MICPRCSVAEISGATGACELCGYVPDGNVAVDIPHPDATDGLARQQLAHEFRLDVLLGHGHQSAVYLAREGNSSRYVVLKVLPRPTDRDPQADERFRRACELAATLDHPHIVAVHRYGSSDSLFWYTMDHVRARSLREILRSRGPLELKMCQRVVAQIASALDYAHRRGVVHGDLKPENVLIDPNGWVHLCDALIKRELEKPAAPLRPSQAAPSAPHKPPQPGARGTPPGSPRPSQWHPRPTPPGEAPPRVTPAEGRASPARRPDYTAPEDLRSGQRTPNADQYAMAVLVHECLTGSLPSAGADAFEPPATLGALRPDLPPHVLHAVQRALSPKPGDRYPSVLDFAMALETGVMALTDSRPSGRASDIVLTVPDWKPPETAGRRWQWPVVILVVLAIAGYFAVPPVRRWQTERRWAQQLQAPVSRTPSLSPADSAARAARAAADSLARLQPPPGSSVTRTTRPEERSTPRRATRDDPSPPRQASRPVSGRPRPAPEASPAPPAAASGEMGRLSVNAAPWGQLFIDGQPVGNTPKANLAVPAGTHTIRVVREGYETVERQVQVGAGETVRVTDIVLTPRP